MEEDFGGLGEPIKPYNEILERKVSNLIASHCFKVTLADNTGEYIIRDLSELTGALIQFMEKWPKKKN